MLWAISRVAAPNFAAMREKGFQAHLDYLHSHKKILVVSGATLTDDGKEILGSLLIVNVNSRAEAKAFADAVRSAAGSDHANPLSRKESGSV